MRGTSVRWALLTAGLALAGCSGESAKPAGSGGTTASAAAASSSSGSSSGSSGASGSSGSSGATGSGSGASSGGSGSSGAGSSSGSTGGGAHIRGSVTYNARPLAHEAVVAVFDHKPLPNDPSLKLITTDGGTFDLGPLDGGNWWLEAAYAPGTVTGGPVLPDGGLWPGWVPGEYAFDPIPLSGDTTADIDLSPLRATVFSLTVNVSGLPPDAGLAQGGYPLPDGGLLFPALILAAVGGRDPVTSLPINDATLVTAGTDGGSQYSLSYRTGAAGEPDNELYSYRGPLSPLSSIRAAEDDVYTFTVAGSSVIGATETRRLEVSPLRDVPVIASPADHASLTGNSVTVAWVDAQGGSGSSIDVDDDTAAPAPSTRVCSLGFPQHTPVTVDNQAGCAFQHNHVYKITVYSLRVHDQPQGTALELAAASVHVTF